MCIYTKLGVWHWKGKWQFGVYAHSWAQKKTQCSCLQQHLSVTPEPWSSREWKHSFVQSEGLDQITKRETQGAATSVLFSWLHIKNRSNGSNIEKTSSICCCQVFPLLRAMESDNNHVWNGPLDIIWDKLPLKAGLSLMLCQVLSSYAPRVGP